MRLFVCVCAHVHNSAAGVYLDYPSCAPCSAKRHYILKNYFKGNHIPMDPSGKEAQESGRVIMDMIWIR